MAVDHGDDVADVQVDRPKFVVDCSPLWPVGVIDEGVAFADTGVHQDHPFRVPDGERIDDARLTGKGMEAREGHCRQGEGDHVGERERTHRWRLYSRRAALDRSPRNVGSTGRGATGQPISVLTDERSESAICAPRITMRSRACSACREAGSHRSTRPDIGTERLPRERTSPNGNLSVVKTQFRWVLGRARSALVSLLGRWS